MEFNDYYPKVENLGIDFLKDSRIIRNLIFAIQQVTIMQVLLTCLTHPLYASIVLGE